MSSSKGSTAFAVEHDTTPPRIAVADEPPRVAEPRPLAPPDRRFVYVDAERRTHDRDSRRRRALATGDALAISLAFAVVMLVAPGPTGGSVLVALLAIPPWIVLNKALRLYDRDQNLIHKSSLNELPAIMQSLAVGAAVAFLVAPTIGGPDVTRLEVLLFWVVAVALTLTLRYAARATIRRTLPPERVLIVGSGTVASLVSRKLAAHPEYGTCVLGYVDEPGARDERTDDVPALGTVRQFEDVCRAQQVERVLIAFSSLKHEHLLDMIRVAKRMRLKVSVVPRLFEVIGTSVEIDQVEGMTVLGLRGLNRSASTLALKRATDVCGALAALTMAAPVMILAAIAVRVTSSGPVLFRQARVGRGHEHFEMLKFRTMLDGAEAMKDALRDRNEMDGRMFKIADDPRVTRIGRFLRRTSLDELPQLINVLRGEMSLVGPRPLVPDENENIIGWHRARLDITPGLTGPWQVMGRNAIPFDEMVKLDYLYVADWSLWNDVKLLVRTLPVVFGQRGS